MIVIDKMLIVCIAIILIALRSRRREDFKSCKTRAELDTEIKKRLRSLGFLWRTKNGRPYTYEEYIDYFRNKNDPSKMYMFERALKRRNELGDQYYYGKEEKEQQQAISELTDDEITGLEFEEFTTQLLQKIGYINVEKTKASGDQGVDVIAEKDGVRYAIQCKKYSTPLGNTPVQEVHAGKQFYNCHVGVVLTNNYFTPGAKALAEKTQIMLWDKDKLNQMIAMANIDVEIKIDENTELSVN